MLRITANRTSLGKCLEWKDFFAYCYLLPRKVKEKKIEGEKKRKELNRDRDKDAETIRNSDAHRSSPCRDRWEGFKCLQSFENNEEAFAKYRVVRFSTS